MASWCRRAGAEVTVLERVPGRPSVVARVRGRGTGPSLMLNAHLDTVGVAGMDRPFTPTVNDGMLRGRGSADTKAGLAASMVALERAVQHPPAGDLVLAAVADEELDSRGTEELVDHLRADGLQVDRCIVLEPTSMELCVAHRGFVVHEVTFTGRRSHTSQPHLGVNAIGHLGRLLAELARFDEALDARPRHPPPRSQPGAARPRLRWDRALHDPRRRVGPHRAPHAARRVVGGGGAGPARGP